MVLKAMTSTKVTPLRVSCHPFSTPPKPLPILHQPVHPTSQGSFQNHLLGLGVQAPPCHSRMLMATGPELTYSHYLSIACY